MKNEKKRKKMDKKIETAEARGSNREKSKWSHAPPILTKNHTRSRRPSHTKARIIKILVSTIMSNAYNYEQTVFYWKQ